MVQGYSKVGRPGSTQLAMKFRGADALGFMMGARNRISVIDVDTRDERVLARCLSKHGHTPLIVRTPSGGFHCYYRHNGEGRRIRHADKVDLLGGGFVVGPPSVTPRGRYQIIEGSLDDVRRLPVAGGIAPAASPQPDKRGTGTRNNDLWR